MQYYINPKNIKQSVQNLASFFKEKQIDIPRNVLFDAFSKSIFFKNWNTLNGCASKPQIIQHMDEKKIYLIEIECCLDLEILKNLLKEAFVNGKCNAQIDNIIHAENTTHFEISFSKNADNFLTSMILMAQNMKKHKVKRFDMMRIVQEKESLMLAIQ